MVATYFWNLALSEALYPTLQSLEVAVRNAIHATATRAYGTDLWFDRSGLLLPRERNAIAEARLELTQHRKPLNAGRIVAALSFGFWTSVLSRPYERPIWHANRLALLRAAFPHAPRRFQNRGAIWDRCNEIRRLRNRIMHAEPVWNRASLQQEQNDILEAVGWISPELHDTIGRFDRFPAVYLTGRAAIAAEIRAYLGIP